MHQQLSGPPSSALSAGTSTNGPKEKKTNESSTNLGV